MVITTNVGVTPRGEKRKATQEKKMKAKYQRMKRIAADALQKMAEMLSVDAMEEDSDGEEE